MSNFINASEDMFVSSPFTSVAKKECVPSTLTNIRTSIMLLGGAVKLKVDTCFILFSTRIGDR